MRIEATRTFIKHYKKLPAEIQEHARKTLTLFEVNPAHPSLGHKKMAGQLDIYELRVTKSYRITYQRAGEVVYLRKIGTHDLLRNP